MIKDLPEMMGGIAAVLDDVEEKITSTLLPDDQRQNQRDLIALLHVRLQFMQTYMIGVFCRLMEKEDPKLDLDAVFFGSDQDQKEEG